MDNETIIKQFDEIEFRVETLIEACKTLEAANSELKDKVDRLESELRSKNETEDRDKEAKALIRTKIDSLMEKLDGITEAEPVQ